MNLNARKILLSCLVLCFLVQTYFVYSDPEGRKSSPLSQSAREGQKIWLSHNCQSCHQIYGFGGFLGPDLTNAAKRLSSSRVQSILTEGSAQMPAYNFSQDEQDVLMSFFKEIDQTGQGTPSLKKGTASDPVLHFYASVQTLHNKNAKTLSEDAQKGFELVQSYSCISCHLPNTHSVYQAPDLTELTKNQDPEFISKVLVEGRVEKGMPPFQLSENDRKSVIEFLKWLNLHREDLLKHYSHGESMSLFTLLEKIPWFEYE